MKKPINIYVLPGKLRRAGTRRVERVSFFIDAESAEDARWQVKHGVINSRIAGLFPGAWFTVNLSKLRLYQKQHMPGRPKKPCK